MLAQFGGRNRKLTKSAKREQIKTKDGGKSSSPLIPISNLVIGLSRAVPSDSGDGASQTNTRGGGITIG